MGAARGAPLGGPVDFPGSPLASSGLPSNGVTWGVRRRHSWPFSLGRNLYILMSQGALQGLFSAPCHLPEIPLKRDPALAPPLLGSVLRRYLALKSDVTWGSF